MKQLFYIFALIVILVVTLITLHSCTKRTEDTDYDCDNTVQQYYLSASAKARIPYTGFDTISMVSNMGDTVHCVGGGKMPFTTYELERNLHPSCGNHGTEKYYEAYKIIFKDSVKKMSIELNHYEKVFYPSGFKEVWDYNTVCYSVKNINFFIPDHHISDFEVATYIGSVVLNGKEHKQVNKVFKDYKDSSYYVLMNKDIGVIQIKLTPNEIWTLLN